MAKGKFICLEGTDGSGKSTHRHYIVHSLRERGLRVVSTEEPGGTRVAEKLADLLLYYAHESIFPQTELLLFFAARCQHLGHFIIPHLERGNWVVSDRFLASSYAYQGGGHSLGAARVAALEAYLPPTRPDLTLIFDLPEEAAARRREKKDRFERRNRDFYERVRAAYLEFAARTSNCHIIDTRQPLERVCRLIDARLDSL